MIGMVSLCPNDFFFVYVFIADHKILTMSDYVLGFTRSKM